MLNWWLGRGIAYLCAFVMSSSENVSPIQWLFSQVSGNLGFSVVNQDKFRNCHLLNCRCQVTPTSLVEVFNNSFSKLKVSDTNKKHIHSPTVLFDISNKNCYQKAVIVLDTNKPSVKNSAKSTSNVYCSDPCQSFTNKSISQFSLNTASSKSVAEPFHTFHTLEPSTCVLEVAQDRMVTTPLSANNVPYNAYQVVDKKKSHAGAERSSSFSNSKGFCGNRSKNKENFVKCKDPSLENKKDFTNKKKGEKNFSESREPHRQQNSKIKSENVACVENADEKSKRNKQEKEPDLEEVGKLLQQVLWKNTDHKHERNNISVAKASSGGSDTGYSSRCSTPPAPGHVTDASVEDERADQKRTPSEFASFPLPSDDSDENGMSRSESPSTCSDTSTGSSSSNSIRGRNNYQGGYQQRFNFYPQHSQKHFQRPPQQQQQQQHQCYIMPYVRVEEGEQHKRQNNGYNSYNNNRMRNQGSNEGGHFNYRKVDMPYHEGGQPHHSHSNSSHHHEMDKGGKYNHHGGRMFNQKGDGKGRNWSYNNNNSNNNNNNNHRYQNTKNRHYVNYPNFQAPNYNNGFPNANIYYQVDSQFDLREQVYGGYVRRLSDRAGSFTVPEQGKWRRDHTMEVIANPPELLTNPVWDDLSLQVWNLFSKHQQLDSTFRAKMELKQRISHVIWNLLPMCGLFVVGSSLSGFGANSSDVDMCLMVTPRDLDQRNEAQAVLRLLQRELNNCGFVEKMELITAKVPILKFRDLITKIDVDLNCNNSVGIRNTHLLNAYSQLDWRVRPLVLVVKLWAQHHHINNAKDMTISSYSLVLMVIHFLQYGLETPLLPCLQRAYPDKFNPNNHVFRMPVTERMPLFVSKNTQTLGELFFGFLEYYAYKFTFIENSISIRTGGILPTEECRYVRTRKNDSRMWKYLCIEEPFDLTNTARSVYDEVVFEKVKNVFKDSHKLLKDTKDLNTIFPPQKINNPTSVFPKTK